MIDKSNKKFRGRLRKSESNIIRGARNNDTQEIDNALLENPESIREQDSNTLETALHILARRGCFELFARLLSVPGVDLTIRDRDGFDVLDAAGQGSHPSIMDIAGRAYFPQLDDIRAPKID